MKPFTVLVALIALQSTGCRSAPRTITPSRPQVVLEIQKQEHGPTTARAQIIFGNTH